MKLILALPLLLSLAIMACSGEDDDPGSVATAPPASTAAVTPPSGGTPSASPVSTDTPSGNVPTPQRGDDDSPVTIRPDPDPPTGVGTLVDVRVGAHPEDGGYDRIVFEFADVLPPGEVRYINDDDAVQCGSGERVDLAGDEVLQVAFTGANAHTEAGEPTVQNRNVTGPGESIEEARQTCDFEANVTWHIGVDDDEDFRVTVLENPTRVVIDVEH